MIDRDRPSAALAEQRVRREYERVQAELARAEAAIKSGAPLSGDELREMKLLIARTSASADVRVSDLRANTLFKNIEKIEAERREQMTLDAITALGDQPLDPRRASHE